MRRAWLAVGLVVFGYAGTAFAQAPPPTDPAAAREQLKIGFSLSQEGKCPEAIPHLQESVRLDAKAIALLNLANCEELTGKLAAAMGHWVDARSRAQAESARPIEEEAEKRIAALEPRLPRLSISLAPGASKDASVERDGFPVGAASLNISLPVDPGPHTIVVKLKGHADSKLDVKVAEGEVKKVEVAPSEELVAQTAPPPGGDQPQSGGGGGISPLVWAGFGLALVGIGVGTVTGLMAFDAGREAEGACPDGHCKTQADKDNADSGKTMGTVSTIAFIAGGIGLGLGIYGLASGPSKKAEPSPTAKLHVGPGSVMLRGTF